MIIEQGTRLARASRVVVMVTMLLAGAVPALGQGLTGQLTWDFSSPTSKTKEFTDKSSWRGSSLDVSVFVNENVSLGGQFGWHVFDQQTTELISIRNAEVEIVDGDTIALNGDIAGTQFRYLNATPIMFETRYYSGTPGAARIYAGSGIGALRAAERLEIGRFAFQRTNWKFAIAPEAGVLLPLGDEANVVIGARYYYGVKSGTSIAGEGTNTQYFTLQVGLSFGPS